MLVSASMAYATAQVQADSLAGIPGTRERRIDGEFVTREREELGFAAYSPASSLSSSARPSPFPRNAIPSLDLGSLPSNADARNPPPNVARGRVGASAEKPKLTGRAGAGKGTSGEAAAGAAVKSTQIREEKFSGEGESFPKTLRTGGYFDCEDEVVMLQHMIEPSMVEENNGKAVQRKEIEDQRLRLVLADEEESDAEGPVSAREEGELAAEGAAEETAEVTIAERDAETDTETKETRLRRFLDDSVDCVDCTEPADCADGSRMGDSSVPGAVSAAVAADAPTKRTRKNARKARGKKAGKKSAGKKQRNSVAENERRVQHADEAAAEAHADVASEPTLAKGPSGLPASPLASAAESAPAERTCAEAESSAEGDRERGFATGKATEGHDAELTRSGVAEGSAMAENSAVAEGSAGAENVAQRLNAQGAGTADEAESKAGATHEHRNLTKVTTSESCGDDVEEELRACLAGMAAEEEADIRRELDDALIFGSSDGEAGEAEAEENWGEERGAGRGEERMGKGDREGEADVEFLREDCGEKGEGERRETERGERGSTLDVGGETGDASGSAAEAAALQQQEVRIEAAATSGREEAGEADNKQENGENHFSKEKDPECVFDAPQERVRSPERIRSPERAHLAEEEEDAEWIALLEESLAERARERQREAAERDAAQVAGGGGVNPFALALGESEAEGEAEVEAESGAEVEAEVEAEGEAEDDGESEAEEIEMISPRGSAPSSGIALAAPPCEVVTVGVEESVDESDVDEDESDVDEDGSDVEEDGSDMDREQSDVEESDAEADESEVEGQSDVEEEQSDVEEIEMISNPRSMGGSERRSEKAGGELADETNGADGVEMKGRGEEKQEEEEEEEERGREEGEKEVEEGGAEAAVLSPFPSPLPSPHHSDTSCRSSGSKHSAKSIRSTESKHSVKSTQSMGSRRSANSRTSHAGSNKSDRSPKSIQSTHSKASNRAAAAQPSTTSAAQPFPLFTTVTSPTKPFSLPAAADVAVFRFVEKENAEGGEQQQQQQQKQKQQKQQKGKEAENEGQQQRRSNGSLTSSPTGRQTRQQHQQEEAKCCWQRARRCALSALSAHSAFPPPSPSTSFPSPALSAHHLLSAFPPPSPDAALRFLCSPSFPPPSPGWPLRKIRVVGGNRRPVYSPVHRLSRGGAGGSRGGGEAGGNRCGGEEGAGGCGKCGGEYKMCRPLGRLEEGEGNEGEEGGRRGGRGDGGEAGEGGGKRSVKARWSKVVSVPASMFTRNEFDTRRTRSDKTGATGATATTGRPAAAAAATTISQQEGEKGSSNKRKPQSVLKSIRKIRRESTTLPPNLLLPSGFLPTLYHFTSQINPRIAVPTNVLPGHSSTRPFKHQALSVTVGP
ncbi:unnamed protein product [Closterium sp. Naga37s-1]|nr:unnamed protein product [Closterium sp. Naga37s-1]